MKSRKLDIQVKRLMGSATSARYSVRVDGMLTGFLEKYEDTATDTHPWKMFTPRFVARQPAQFGEMIGAYYGPREGALTRLCSFASEKTARGAVWS